MHKNSLKKAFAQVINVTLGLYFSNIERSTSSMEG